MHFPEVFTTFHASLQAKGSVECVCADSVHDAAIELFFIKYSSIEASNSHFDIRTIERDVFLSEVIYILLWRCWCEDDCNVHG